MPKCRWLVVVGVALCCWGETAFADTVVQTLRDGRPVAGIDVVIVTTVSGKPIRSGRSGRDGKIRFEGLEEGAAYQAQTSDGTVFSESFSAGSKIELEVGRGGWNVALRVGLAVGTETSLFKASGGLDTEESEVAVGPGLGLLIFAPPAKLLIHGVRPFMQTEFEFPVLSPDGLTDTTGSTAKIDDQFRWRLGGGLAIPITLRSYDFGVEPSIHYVLTSSELTQESPPAAELTDEFISHAMQLRLAVVLPVGTVGAVDVGIDFGAQAHIPISGSTTNTAGLEGEAGIGVYGFVGVRGSFSGLWTGK